MNINNLPQLVDMRGKSKGTYSKRTKNNYSPCMVSFINKKGFGWI
ncbi:hypothetical protein ACQKMY_21705 [Peribacillus frigoritolerans]